MLLMKQPTKLMKIYLRELSVNPDKKHYLHKILRFKYDIKKRWIIMKEIVGKAKHKKNQTFIGNLKLVTK